MTTRVAEKVWSLRLLYGIRPKERHTFIHMNCNVKPHKPASVSSQSHSKTVKSNFSYPVSFNSTKNRVKSQHRQVSLFDLIDTGEASPKSEETWGDLEESLETLAAMPFLQQFFGVVQAAKFHRIEFKVFRSLFYEWQECRNNFQLEKGSADL
ncbi:MAG: hypothetical protein SFY66_10795 [Oculatellaceae cyanobacterium bins.114]|nr:hypothetical protein [Oculatellaceae cyanobacterium bins.114]